ncbi:hypothetical protein Riv7116_4887 [Rivularia sp. PCC 7116]|uniref:hypothetical protein n=1 Tax=Rivularia sp. PCC 7116 TaxID=373994 RepID=UPI00029F1D42|nr:hypothetical protein [Rivularia sp. PCC 7116]AFY57297.1 hypothetical protein Riv7116_4887 [Rivularia sp. PCC 7116]
MKNIIKKAAVISIFTLISFTNISIKVIAGEMNFSVKRISSTVATGNSKSAIPLIKLSPGYGVNISFIPTGETIEKVWLDNPSIASLDVDGCLSGLGKECEEDNSATVLHLRRIKPLDFKQLPSSSSSLLTVVARGNDKRRVYVFRITPGDTTPKFHTIEITNDKEEFNTNRFGNTTDIKNLQLISRGLIVARQQRLISLKSPLIPRVKNFLVLVRAGEQINMAARKNGISLQLVNRLMQLGNESYETFK